MAHVEPERRQYRRLNAPVVCRPLGGSTRGSQELAPLEVADISLGGLRVYSDDKHKIGERLELELWLPDGEGIVLETTIRWIEALPAGSDAKFEIGLQFVDAAKEDLAKLETVLKDV